tara:strand:+ start:1826 stop:2521 length:696 start_codon:yes stop_codon:yes gene_type:complete
MKKITLLFLLMLEIGFTAQTKDNFKNLFAIENIPSINVSTWFGFPAYFNKENTEEMFSMSLMQTNPFIMPVYDVESRNSGPIGVNIDVFINEKLSVGFSYVNNSFSYNSKRDAINAHNGNFTTFNYDFKAKKKRYHIRSCYNYYKKENLSLYGGGAIGFGSNFLELTTDDELYDSPFNMISDEEKTSISSRFFTGFSYNIYKNFGPFTELGFTYDKDDFLGLFRIGIQYFY